MKALLLLCLTVGVAVPAVATQIAFSKADASWLSSESPRPQRRLPEIAFSPLFVPGSNPPGFVQPPSWYPPAMDDNPVGRPRPARPSELIEDFLCAGGSAPLGGSAVVWTSPRADVGGGMKTGLFSSSRILPGGDPSDRDGTIRVRFSIPEPRMIILFGLTGLAMFRRRVA